MRLVPTTAALRRKGLLAGLAVVALAASACGSDSGSTTSTTAAATTPATSAASSANSSSAPTSGGASSTSGEASTSTSGGSGATVEAALPNSADCSDPASGDAKTATSAEDLGGICGLIAAAKAEGALNVIALPPDWANYGTVIDTFRKKYPEITVNSQQPDASSAQEIQAAEAAKGTTDAPDVFDVGTAVALESLDYFAPYKVTTWDAIPEGNKEETGLWVNDYTGVMTVGYNSDEYGEITSLDQLTDAKFQGAVALNGNPTEANAALNGVVFAALANGGSLDDISAGVDYFKGLKDAGTLSSVDPTPATITSGQVGVVFDWSYNQLGVTKQLEAEGVTWKTFTPSGVALGSFYNQAINKDAPHPAAARLWQEYLFSSEAQNIWMSGGASPVLYEAMKASGTVDAASEANLPTIDSAVVQLSQDQAKAVNTYLADNWSKAVGS
nr:ABC transporter substrate-binding protein [Nakamurella alba]